MVKYLIGNGVSFLELLGVVLIIVGVALWLGVAAALIAAGLALLAKSFELDVRRGGLPR